MFATLPRMPACQRWLQSSRASASACLVAREGGVVAAGVIVEGTQPVEQLAFERALSGLSREREARLELPSSLFHASPVRARPAEIAKALASSLRSATSFAWPSALTKQPRDFLELAKRSQRPTLDQNDLGRHRRREPRDRQHRRQPESSPNLDRPAQLEHGPGEPRRGGGRRAVRARHGATACGDEVVELREARCARPRLRQAAEEAAVPDSRRRSRRRGRCHRSGLRSEGAASRTPGRSAADRIDSRRPGGRKTCREATGAGRPTRPAPTPSPISQHGLDRREREAAFEDRELGQRRLLRLSSKIP